MTLFAQKVSSLLSAIQNPTVC